MKKFLKYSLIGLIVVGIIGAGAGYYVLMSPNSGGEPEGTHIYIDRGATFEDALAELEAKEVVKNSATFSLTAKALKYDQLVKPGHYLVKPGMSNLKLVRQLRSGAQTEIKLRFRAHVYHHEIASEIAKQMEFGEGDLMQAMEDEQLLNELGVEKQNLSKIFIPNTYHVYWTLTPREFLERMKSEFDKFWNEDRKNKAEQLKMSPHEVVTLASIVQAETYIVKERPTVAGVYLNRLRKNMLLQADPTVLYAIGDTSIRRVLHKHLQIDSPYNTYKYAGLPPGPINNPEISAIDAVLNYETHNYLYFCAKPDFSGHNFAASLAEHNRNARLYWNAIKGRY